jgi:hypothetical protein
VEFGLEDGRCIELVQISKIMACRLRAPLPVSGLLNKRLTKETRSEDSSVGLMMGYGLDGRSSIPGRGSFILFSRTYRPALRVAPSLLFSR